MKDVEFGDFEGVMISERAAPRPVVMSRADDLEILEILYRRDVLGWSMQKIADHDPHRSRNAIIGRIGRVRDAPEVPDKCRKKANRDGGMPDRWWA